MSTKSMAVPGTIQNKRGVRLHQPPWLTLESEFGVSWILIIYVLNLEWIKNIMKGKYSPYRIFLTAVNTIVLLSMIGLITSGIIMSQYVFENAGFGLSMSFARKLHMVTAYGGFIFMSIHIGLHWAMFMGMSQKILKSKCYSKRWIAVLRVIAASIAGYGMYALIDHDIFLYVFLVNEFAFFDFEQISEPNEILPEELSTSKGVDEIEDSEINNEIVSDSGSNKVLIDYFTWADNTVVENPDEIDIDATTSASVLPPGNTGKVAGWIHDVTGGDIFRIITTEPYPGDYVYIFFFYIQSSLQVYLTFRLLSH